MQHVLTLRKIFLIFGFALVVFGCDTDNAQLTNANKEVLAAMYSYSASGELSGYQHKYEHDSNGKQTRWNEYTADGELQSYIVFLYKSI